MALTHFAHRTVLHSVTQSTFDHPCTYLAASNSSSAGFDSGLHPGKEFNLTVTNDQEREPTFPSPCPFPVQHVFNYCDSGLFLLQGSATLWSWNGWVSIKSQVVDFFNHHVPTYSCSTINAPSTGNTGAAFLAAAKAIGTNEPTVGHSPYFLAPHVNDVLPVMQLTTDSGPVTGGVGAVATSTPTSTSSPSPSSSKSSDARRLVARGVFALLAPALGIALA
jgi:hypothetical protein